MNEDISLQEWRSWLPARLRTARIRPKGRAFEHFAEDETFHHHSVERSPKHVPSSRPGFGIVGWHTEGFLGERLAIAFRRTNLVKAMS